MSGQKLLIYGGTFDPPHIGHLNNLRAAMQAVRPDRVLVMPAGTPPHKLASETPAEWRYEMCGCFRQLGPQVAISRWEIDHEARAIPSTPSRRCTKNTPRPRLIEPWQRYAGKFPPLVSVGAGFCSLRPLFVQSRANGDDASLRAAAEALAPAGGRVVFAKARRCRVPRTRSAQAPCPPKPCAPSCRPPCRILFGVMICTGWKSFVKAFEFSF